MQVTSISLDEPYPKHEPLSLTPDGTRAMWRSDAKTLQVADLVAGTVQSSKSTSRGGSSRCISVDGKAFAEWGLTQKKRIKIWREGPKKFASKSHDLGLDEVTAAGFLADGHLAVGDREGRVVIVDEDAVIQHSFSAHGESVMHARIVRVWGLRDGSILMAGGDDGVPNRSGALHRHGRDGEHQRAYGLFTSSKCATLSPDEGTLALGFAVGSNVHLIDLEAGTMRELPLPGKDVRSLSFSSDGTLLFVALKDGWEWAAIDVASEAVVRQGAHLAIRSIAGFHALSACVIESRNRVVQAVDVRSGNTTDLGFRGTPSAIAGAPDRVVVGLGTRLHVLQ